MININEEIFKTIDVLKKGGVILYPTDTIWGIGCDATNEKAVQKIYEIKKRTDSKAMLVLIDSENKLNQYVYKIPEMAWQLIDVAVDPLTIIYPEGINLASNLLADDKSIGIRIVKEDFCNQLIYKFKKPLVSTSANISGSKNPERFSEISEEIKKSVDYVVNWKQEDNSRRKPSSIIKLGINNEIVIIRK
jgi:L-threonylcarbamoyladenylate synthase